MEISELTREDISYIFELYEILLGPNPTNGKKFNPLMYVNNVGFADPSAIFDKEAKDSCLDMILEEIKKEHEYNRDMPSRWVDRCKFSITDSYPNIHDPSGLRILFLINYDSWMLTDEFKKSQIYIESWQKSDEFIAKAHEYLLSKHPLG